MGTTITSATSGDWNNTATWVGGVIPDGNNDDTSIIDDGHTVVIPDSITVVIGDASDLDTKAIRTSGSQGTGKLVVNGTLRLKGHVFHHSEWTINAGGIVESANTSDSLIWELDGEGSASSTPHLRLLGTGPGSDRAIFRKGSGAGLRITHGSGGAPGWSLTSEWGLFKDLGTASDDAIVLSQFWTGQNVLVSDTIFDGCGQVNTYLGPYSHTRNEWLRTTIKGSLHDTYSANFSGVGGALSAGTRIVDRCVFDKRLRTTGGEWEITNNVFGNVPHLYTGGWSLFEDNLVVDSSAGGGDLLGYEDITRGFICRNNPAGGNWHCLSFIGLENRSFTADGIIFDAVVDDAYGDLIKLDGSEYELSLIVQNCLTTKSQHESGAYGKLISSLAGETLTFSAFNNTAYTANLGEPALFGYGEGYAGHEDMIYDVQNNLAVGLTANSGLLLIRQATGAAANAVDVPRLAGISNNAVFNANSGGANVGVGNATVAGGDGVMFSATPPAPLDVDPQFYDDTRNLATWYRSVVGGSPGTRTDDMAAAIALLSTVNDDIPPSASVSIVNAYNWIKDGYRPTNPALKTDVSANNGGWIGAVAGIESTPSTATHITILLNSSYMHRDIRRNEPSASLRRLPLHIYTPEGAAWNESVTGVKARLSIDGGTETDSPADIVRVGGTLHYLELAQAYVDVAPLSVIVARVPEAEGRLPAVADATIIPADAVDPVLTDAQIAKAVYRSQAGLDGYGVTKDVPNSQLVHTIPGEESPVAVPAVFSESSPGVSSFGSA